jgi:hypothetical protein
MEKKWSYVRWRYHKIRRRIIRTVCSKLYRDTNRDIQKNIIVAGTARSGTTWLADVIASQTPCRIMFEPFHSKLVEAFHHFHYFQYMRPKEQNDELFDYCLRVFSGDIRHGWIDRQVEHFFPRYRLIKEIRANLFLKWIQNRFPEIPILFVVRHPCAVVLSRMELGWATDTDIEPFLSQADLVDDFLADKIDIIRRAETVEEKHAIIWCISNLIPLKQFNSDGLNVFFYENLCLKPEIEAPRIWRTIRQEYQDSVLEHFDKPSTTTVNSSAIVTGQNKLTQWKKELSPKQINNILSIVDNFGLGYIYRDACTPIVSCP